MRELDHKEGWAPKNWCFRTVVLENTLESPLYIKEIKPVNPKGNQLWTFIGRTDTEAESPILWPPDKKSLLTGKDPYAGKDWGWGRKGRQRMKSLDGITDLMDMSLSMLQELVGGQGSLAYCIHGVTQRSDMTEWLNWTECFFEFTFEIYVLIARKKEVSHYIHIASFLICYQHTQFFLSLRF